jgi:hypothetical protein
MTSLERKVVELDWKLRSLPHELSAWRELSEIGQPFEKHHSQIRRLALQMEALHDQVVVDFKRATTAANLLDSADSLEKRSLAVHTVWDFFRAKFALRAVEPLGSYLKMADAFARECYDPVRQQFVAAGGADRCEPPLVTFDNRVSPWAVSREGKYAPASDPGGIVATTAFSQVVSMLPIPLLGLPWHYITYLPHVVFLAHECGHAVEKDFALNKGIQEALGRSGVDTERLPAWQAWQREMFADVFACYATGPSYTAALAEVLTRDRSRIEVEVKTSAKGWSSYPTAALRMLLNIATLEHLGFQEDAKTLRDRWCGDYPTHAMKAFEHDLPAVVRALLDGAALPGRGLVFTAADRAQSRKTADLYLAGGKHPETDVYAVRVLIAAAREIQKSSVLAPESLERHWAALCRHAVNSRPPGLLTAEKQRASQLDPQKERTEAGRISDLLFGALENQSD